MDTGVFSQRAIAAIWLAWIPNGRSPTDEISSANRKSRFDIFDSPKEQIHGDYAASLGQ